MRPDRFDMNAAIKFLEEWDASHPVKTYAQDFFEKFPNAKRRMTGVPMVCVPSIYPEYHKVSCFCPDGMLHDCTACWNRPMPEGECK